MNPEDYRCPHCGGIDLRRSPSLERTYDLLQERGELDAGTLAELEELTTQAASNRLARLREIGAAREEGVTYPKRWGPGYTRFVPRPLNPDTSSGEADPPHAEP